MSAIEFDTGTLRAIQQRMASTGRVHFLRGLNDAEVSILERKFDFRFPPELRAFLQVGVPVSVSEPVIPSELPACYQTAKDGWHNWHNLVRDDVPRGSEGDTVTKQIAWHATPEGGVHPREYPLIPIYAHRMIPTVPHAAGNPVFSMHGCYDNIVYGDNFWDWLGAERYPTGRIPAAWQALATAPEDIPFWCDFLD